MKFPMIHADERGETHFSVHDIQERRGSAAIPRRRRTLLQRPHRKRACDSSDHRRNLGVHQSGQLLRQLQVADISDVTTFSILQHLA